MCNKEKPSHSFTVFGGQSGIISDCECRAKWKPLFRGPGAGGAGAPGIPGYPEKLPFAILVL